MEDDIRKVITEKYKDRKICVAWPSPEKTDYRFNHDMLSFINQNALYLNISIANRVSSRIAVNRNGLVQDARQQGATDIMWVDGDTKFPVNGLLRLLSHDKDIVCATTARRMGNDMRPIGTPVSMELNPGQVLYPLKWVGMPFMLTRISVFDKLDEMFIKIASSNVKRENMPYFAEPPRWVFPDIIADSDNPDPLVGEDEYFCYHARKAGYEIFCDEELSMAIGHIGSTIYYISDQRRPAVGSKIDEML